MCVVLVRCEGYVCMYVVMVRCEGCVCICVIMVQWEGVHVLECACLCMCVVMMRRQEKESCRMVRRINARRPDMSVKCLPGSLGLSKAMEGPEEAS